MFGGAPPEHVEALAGYGETIGVAFQLSDDLLDIASESVQSGKTPGTDLREGVPTLPVLYALAGDDTDAASVRLREILAAGPLTDDALHAEALGLLRESAALKRARETVRSYAEEARAQLGAAAGRPGRAARWSRSATSSPTAPAEPRAGPSARRSSPPRRWSGGRRQAARLPIEHAGSARRRTASPRAATRPHRRVAAPRGERAQAERAEAAARVHPGLGDRGGRGRRLRVQPDHREVHQPRPGPAQAEAEHHADDQRRRPARRAAPARPRRPPACPAITPTWPVRQRSASQPPPTRAATQTALPRVSARPARPGERPRATAESTRNVPSAFAARRRQRRGHADHHQRRGGPLAAGRAGPAGRSALLRRYGRQRRQRRHRPPPRTPTASRRSAPRPAPPRRPAACRPGSPPASRRTTGPAAGRARAGPGGVAGQLAERVRGGAERQHARPAPIATGPRPRRPAATPAAGTMPARATVAEPYRSTSAPGGHRGERADPEVGRDGQAQPGRGEAEFVADLHGEAADQEDGQRRRRSVVVSAPWPRAAGGPRSRWSRRCRRRRSAVRPSSQAKPSRDGSETVSVSDHTCRGDRACSTRSGIPSGEVFHMV